MAKQKKIWINGINRTAEAIAKQFKTTCSRQDIRFWMSKEPPFPSPRANNQFNQRECFEWFLLNIIPNRTVAGTAMADLFQQAAQAKARQEIRENEEAEFDFDVKKKRYIERTAAERTIVGCAKKYHGFVRGQLERNLTLERKLKLESLGISREIVAVFYEFDTAQAVGIIDRIEAQCCAAGKEAVDGLAT